MVRHGSCGAEVTRQLGWHDFLVQALRQSIKIPSVWFQATRSPNELQLSVGTFMGQA
uniref:Uncharacterized protein n=1 Tax=Setaria digitata TaxID=48799 RepID=A0A915Q6K0_9BILA